jgi:hypothetical protein
VGSQRVVGVAEQVDFHGEGVAVADGGAVEMMLLIIVNTLVRIMQSKFG